MMDRFNRRAERAGTGMRRTLAVKKTLKVKLVKAAPVAAAKKPSPALKSSKRQKLDLGVAAVPFLKPGVKPGKKPTSTVTSLTAQKRVSFDGSTPTVSDSLCVPAAALPDSADEISKHLTDTTLMSASSDSGSEHAAGPARQVATGRLPPADSTGEEVAIVEVRTVALAPSAGSLPQT
eukprot:GHVT01011890.1.p1 GENE.GHVT01011890.1~~GHVT01011890.1.p1  ORF type:complete len:178 (+),score=26.22 GHVT01011890.1:326-859(+)